jgi:hypothetical protein
MKNRINLVYPRSIFIWVFLVIIAKIRFNHEYLLFKSENHFIDKVLRTKLLCQLMTFVTVQLLCDKLNHMFLIIRFTYKLIVISDSLHYFKK